MIRCDLLKLGYTIRILYGSTSVPPRSKHASKTLTPPIVDKVFRITGQLLSKAALYYLYGAVLIRGQRTIIEICS